MLDNITDEQLANTPLGQVEQMFNAARMLNIEKEFGVEFWQRVSRLKCQSTSLQKAVQLLEDYKKNVGRKLNIGNDIVQRVKYNEIEAEIAWLCKQYNLTRSSKPFSVEVNNGRF